MNEIAITVLTSSEFSFIIVTENSFKGGLLMNVNSIRIEALLAEKGMTKADLSVKSGVSRQSLSTIIRRGTCEPRTVGKIAAGLGVHVDKLLTNKGD